MLRKQKEVLALDDALNRLYAGYQEAFMTSPSGRVAVTARTRLPTGSVDELMKTDHGPAVGGFISLLPETAVLSIMPGRDFDVFTLAW